MVNLLFVFGSLAERKGTKSSDLPFGQPGAGKSSLINELIGEKKAKVGTGTDTTKEAQVIESGSVVYVDLPGYDTARFSQKRLFQPFLIPSNTTFSLHFFRQAYGG